LDLSMNRIRGKTLFSAYFPTKSILAFFAES
jgi:hypothetical protein